jgi:hypothetical protein
MAYQSVEFLSDHGQRTEQAQHIRCGSPRAARQVLTIGPVGINRGMNMRRVLLLVGAIVLIVGIVGLLLPVSIPGPDGQSIGCGNAVVADSSAAREADNNNPVNLPIINEVIPHTDYTAQCNSAVSQRRAWSIPVAIIGLVVVAAAFFVGGRSGRLQA